MAVQLSRKATGIVHSSNSIEVNDIMPDENGEDLSMKKEPAAASGGFSPHSTTTTPPQQQASKVIQQSRIEEDEEDVPSETGASTQQIDTKADSTAPLKQCLAAAVRLSTTVSPKHGERMIQIIADLLIGSIDADEFQHRVQEVISLPFRPLVPPLLERQVPILRQEIADQMLARQHQNGCSTSSAHHQATEQVKALLLDNSRDDKEDQRVGNRNHQWEENKAPVLTEWFKPAMESAMGIAVTRKRRASASLAEKGGSGNGEERASESTTPKRPNVETLGRKNLALSVSSTWTPPRVTPPSSQASTTANGSTHSPAAVAVSPVRQGDEEWANIHTMLNCILSMVEKTRRALGILQQRSNDYHISRQQTSFKRNQPPAPQHNYEASELRRQAGELIAQTLKATEDRVTQVKRKAEEAVHDVRRAAMMELQRALSVERARAERLAAEARRQGAEEALVALGRHSQAKEVCWNCGRRASETCSGCNIARYCSTFCQHKHWELHHKICGRVSQLMQAAAVAAGSTGPVPVADEQVSISPPPHSSRNNASSKSPSPNYVQ